MNLSVIIITKNEENMILDCLESVKFANEIIVVDTGNTDKTNDIAAKFGAKIISSTGVGYAAWRNDGLAAASHPWILFVDADERVSHELAQEIKHLTLPAAYQIPRRNFYLGHYMQHGGWGDEKIIRLFHVSVLQKYIHDLHEQPQFKGDLYTTTGWLTHYSHRDLSSMLDKTILFTNYEARLRHEANHPPIVWWRFIRVMFTEFWLRFVKLQAWRDGPRGIIDGLFQVYNSFIIYARLWELQHGQGANI